MKLRRYRTLGDIFIVRGKRVAHETERAYPDPGSYVHIATGCQLLFDLYSGVHIIRIRVQNSPARRFAGHRFILQQWRVWLVLEGGVNSANRDNKPGCFLCTT
jgi:hypothetical protein